MSQIVEIGWGQAAQANNAAAVATLTMLAGFTLSTDDGILVVYGNGRTTDQDLSSAISVTGCSLEQSDEDFQTDDFPVGGRIELHRVTGTPPTSVTGAAAGAADNACSISVKVFRGIDWTNEFDVALVKVKAGNSGVPNNGSITGVTEGAMLVVAMVTSIGNDSSYTRPTGFVNQRSAQAQGASTGCASGLAHRLLVPVEAVDPPAWTGLTSAATEASIAWTIALRPADTDVPAYIMWVAPGTSSASLSEHRDGDKIYAATFRDGSNTQPGAYPAGYSDIAGVAGDSSSWRAALNEANGSAESDPASANGTTTLAVCLRAAAGYTISHGVIAVAGPGPGTTIDWAALTGMAANGLSRLLAIGLHRSINTSLGATFPTGFTLFAESLDATDHGVVFWKDTDTASHSLVQTSVGGTSSQWRTLVIEVVVTSSAATAAVTGTVTSAATEADIVAGGETIIITLTGDTWLTATAGAFDAIRQDIIDGLDSAQSEGTGWNAEVRDNQAVTGVVRTSDTVVTITLDAQVAYDITAQETITVTVPLTATTLGLAPITATPTFTVDPVAAVTIPRQMYDYRRRRVA